MSRKTIIEDFIELNKAFELLKLEIINNFDYYKKYKNLKNKNKRYRRTIRKLKRQLGGDINE